MTCRGSIVREYCRTKSGTSHILKEDLENTTSFFIYQARDTLHTTTTCETTDGWLGDTYAVCKRVLEGEGKPSHTLNVIPKDLTMALGTALSEALEGKEVNHIVVQVERKEKYLSAFAASRHSV